MSLLSIENCAFHAVIVANLFAVAGQFLSSPFSLKLNKSTFHYNDELHWYPSRF